MKAITKTVMIITKLAKKQKLALSGAMVRDSGHCKFCIRGKDYCN